ncbi:MAG: hypothetical protein CM15mP111_3820 [Hyphomicrobiales bacterium]|nr:MAG: hypothetical protein CM15mP111_3820 [Hyphomicrobiales bacterium]
MSFFGRHGVDPSNLTPTLEKIVGEFGGNSFEKKWGRKPGDRPWVFNQYQLCLLSEPKKPIDGFMGNITKG